MSRTQLAASGTSTRGPGDWRDRAACLDHDAELFFPIGHAPAQTAEAVAVCTGCPVRASCLEHALDIRADDGVWGGMAEAERRSLKRRTARRGRPPGSAPAKRRPAGGYVPAEPIQAIVRDAHQRGWTGIEIADRSGLTRTVVSNLLLGRSPRVTITTADRVTYAGLHQSPPHLSQAVRDHESAATH